MECSGKSLLFIIFAYIKQYWVLSLYSYLSKSSHQPQRGLMHPPVHVIFSHDPALQINRNRDNKSVLAYWILYC